jgi:hypothetical protein
MDEDCKNPCELEQGFIETINKEMAQVPTT